MVRLSTVRNYQSCGRVGHIRNIGDSSIAIVRNYQAFSTGQNILHLLVTAAQLW